MYVLFCSQARIFVPWLRVTRFDELKDAITRAYPELPKQLQRIARFAVDKPHELALGTVAAVAESAGVQPSALIRFANALDFGGFSEMQQVFRGHLVERSASYRERIDELRRRGESTRDGANVLHRFVGEAMAELGHLEEHVRAADVDAAVDLICKASRVHVLAQRRAFPIASYLAYALSQLELKADLLRRHRRHAVRVAARPRRERSADRRQLSQLFAGRGRRRRRRARARRAGGGHHRQRAVAAEAAGARVLRARLVHRAAVSLAGRAAVPGAGAGRERGASACRSDARRRRSERGATVLGDER